MPNFVTPTDDSLVEVNSCHTPAGSSAGGQFCSTPSAGIIGSRTYKSDGERKAAAGQIRAVKPAAFKAALARNTRADTLSDYSEQELANFQLFMLDGGEAGYAIKPGGELVNVFNSGGASTRGAGPWLVLHAVEQGARHLDHFAGFLDGFYQGLGFRETKREKNWTPGGPDVVYREWAGGNPTAARERYRYAGHLNPQ